MFPASPDRAHAADIEACRELLRLGSKSFHAASLLLPRSVRDPATALYAFCRVADDAVDESAAPGPALIRLHARLDRIYAGLPEDHPVDRAASVTVARFALPRAVMDALLEGFAWDAEGRRYEDLSSVMDYSARVAATVGVLMTVLMGARAPRTLARACDLGVAMQLTNIARDVGEDARNGRLYLPRDWMREEGLDPEAWLARPVFDARLGRVVRRLLGVADGLYNRSCAGIRDLPPDCRAAIHAARLVYAEIGRLVASGGYDSVSGRAVVSRSRKLALVARACCPGWLLRHHSQDPALAEVQFLIDAVVREPRLAVPRAVEGGQLLRPFRGFTRRTIGVIELFERVKRRETEGRRGAPAFRGLAQH
ncbi:MAG: phytoene/squalene synthase family protein [Bosea sp.]|nr:phytoene/squalene synthase family protein [Bosea sp. (in: a-proteobacteria)]